MRHTITYLSALVGIGSAFLALNAGIEGVAFGLVDNGVLLIGAYLGFDLGERLGEGRGALGAVLGAVFGNTVSDGLGASLDPAMQTAILGIVIGCLLPIMLVPLCELLTSKINNN